MKAALLVLKFCQEIYSHYFWQVIVHRVLDIIKLLKVLDIIFYTHPLYEEKMKSKKPCQFGISLFYINTLLVMYCKRKMNSSSPFWIYCVKDLCNIEQKNILISYKVTTKQILNSGRINKWISLKCVPYNKYLPLSAN